MTATTTPNKLYYGDNLDILQRYVADESVDLIYLDPPFNSNADYNVLFAEHPRNGTPAHASGGQFRAFEDTWRWDTEAADNFRQAVEHGGSGGRVSDVMRAFETFLGDSDMPAHLSNLRNAAPRLVELHHVLKPTGSIWHGSRGSISVHRSC